ncbi:hypothetical protein VTI74DRAFT_4739 [Chaetomium olivicolor]
MLSNAHSRQDALLERNQKQPRILLEKEVRNKVKESNSRSISDSSSEPAMAELPSLPASRTFLSSLILVKPESSAKSCLDRSRYIARAPGLEILSMARSNHRKQAQQKTRYTSHRHPEQVLPEQDSKLFIKTAKPGHQQEESFTPFTRTGYHPIEPLIQPRVHQPVVPAARS